MERVRKEARRPKTPPTAAGRTGGNASTLPPVAMLPAAPAVWIPGPVKSRKERVDALVETARIKNEPASKIPKFLRRFFRRQGGYNRAMLEGVRALAASNQELTQRATEITVCLGQLNNWLRALHKQNEADATWSMAAAPGVSGIASLEGALDQLKGDLAATCSGLEELVSTKVERVSRDLESTRSGLEEFVNEKVERVSSDL